MPIRTTHWELPPHTRAKHEILRRYLAAWLPILGKWNGRIVFIDGFAGPGRYKGGEPGSPVIALETLLEHKYFQQLRPGREVVFIFIEQDSARVEALRGEVDTIQVPGWVKVDVREGEFVDHMTEILDFLDGTRSRLAPTFALIDPFGFKGLPMRLISRMVSHPRCECLISFIYESVNRFIDHPDPKLRERLDELFGTTAWRDVAEIRDPDTRKDRLTSLYQDQLHEVASLEYVRTFEMINEGNRTAYFLFFGTNDKTGLSKMKQAMWRADPTGGQAFSDRSQADPDQLLLFEPKADTTLLRKELQRRFQGKGWVAIEGVSDFVLEETAFSEAMHLKRNTLAPLEREDLLEVTRPPRKRERPGEYPDGTKVRFL
jgi:three-Cys-motif partner protein